MIWSIMVRLFLILGIGAALTGCSRAESLVELLCACEKCDSKQESDLRLHFETLENVAEAYDCSDEWNALASCIEENGQCDPVVHRWLTRGADSCSRTADIGNYCATDSDCGATIGLFCTENVCKQHICAGTNVACGANSDCNGVGPDLCTPAFEAMRSCEMKASAHGG